MADLDLNLSTDEVMTIASFLGYGEVAAPVWFVGFEEGLGNMNSEDTIRNLKARGSFQRTMDLYHAHLRLREKGQCIDIEHKLPTTQVWRWMAKIMLAFEGQDWENPDLAKEYVRFRLGRSKGKTFLTELSPIPTGRTADKSWITLFQQMDPELGSKIKDRKEELQRILKNNAPSLVICYGSTRANDFAELLAIKWQAIGQRICASFDRRCLLLPFFGNGQMTHATLQELLGQNLLPPGVSG